MKCTPHTQLDKILHSPREFIKGDTKIIISELVVSGMLTPWIALLSLNTAYKVGQGGPILWSPGWQIVGRDSGKVWLKRATCTAGLPVLSGTDNWGGQQSDLKRVPRSLGLVSVSFAAIGPTHLPGYRWCLQVQRGSGDRFYPMQGEAPQVNGLLG